MSDADFRRIAAKPIGRIALFALGVGVVLIFAVYIVAIATFTSIADNAFLQLTYIVGLSMFILGITLIGATLTEIHIDDRLDDLEQKIDKLIDQSEKKEP